MRIAIMQPTYLPWIGYFDLMDQVDLFVFLDQVQFAKRSWQQRNRIKTPKGLEWISVPVRVRGRYLQKINEVIISDPDFWQVHLRSIQYNYSRSYYFKEYFEQLMEIYGKGSPWNYLLDLNLTLIEWIAKTIGITTPMIKSSSLGVKGKRSNLLVEICKEVGADKYISPIGSAGYLLNELDEFEKLGIQVLFHNYQHPEYRQCFGPFIPYASCIDLLLNEGPYSLNVIRNGRGDPYLPDAEAVLASVD